MEKTDRRHYIKIKSFWSSEHTRKKVKTRDIKWAQILATHTTHKGLPPRIYKELPHIRGNGKAAFHKTGIS